ncbi:MULTISPECIES: ABC transporter ATP-binding protein [unclassified Streptococcus]|uniref:ABC transporter ATP-binding protein n=1 Tax=unclassified Streptococcus TaxID=2608887 RepID=UPI0020C8AD64|nr:MULTISPECIES: ABC transporter ATP-binding protein [unclassified Streptococcus]MCP8962011.1 ABC transporter ATP-binding protein/permease [Streptococcus sp. CF8_St5-12]MCP8979951.1 ABC transporter ATP-binding protein/permease [Streptococcus sp. CF8_St5-16]MCP8981881.1 ABC transporter ATP-binding protein/permease [Streptococcus sp. CF8_St5-13]MCP9038755.1 ABC transporter ATP-binding protein/permease [Streptococcus sp. CF8_St5-11]
MKTSEAHVMKRLLTYMWRYKWLTALALAFTFLTSLLLTAIPLAARWYIDHLVDPTEAGSPVLTAFQFLILYYGLFIGRVLATYLSQLTFARVSNSIVRDIRLDIFQNLQRLGMSFYDQTAAGSIVSRVTNDTQAVADMFSTVFSSLVSSFLLFLVTLVTMFSLDWHLTIWILPFLPIIWFSIRLYRKLSNRLVKMTRQKLSDINVKLSESIEGMRIVQAFRQEKRLTDEFEQINGEHLDYANRSVDVNSLFLRPAMTLLQVLAYAVILTFFGLNWQFSGFTAGLIYAFIQYVNQLFQPLIDVTQNFATLQTSTISAGRVFEMMDRDDYEPKQAGSLKEIERGDIRFEHVSFSYDSKRDVLKEISFEVKNGQTIAFVGHTGSGKSSIINLFMRFYEFDRGQILIDGQDIKDYSQEALRKSIGLVLQEPFLYHGTIASNIRMYHEELTNEEIRQAAAFVDVADFIESLPGGYDHPVTERGSTLSTGQRQLLAFARTIAAQPKILILDEATANIDQETEEMIQNSLKKMRQGRTTIAIAHRLSTIQDADCIYVLDKGKIIESGNHDQLIALGGTYKKMYDLQAGMMK